nr:integrase, catalytic region, zinc finger, CCHC-type, peptidase aspartic, catalytic [Tanacetum cinerariifolium]
MSTRSSARNLFPPLDNLELTIRRRSHADPTLLNDFEMATEGNGDLLVPDLQTMEELCQPSLNGRGGPIASISIQATNFGLMNDMIQQLKNEITNFYQRPDESLFEAWERCKLLIDRCPNQNMLSVTQIDTFYNGLALRHRDTINAAVGGTFMKRRPEECYDLIENMTAHHNDWDTSAQRSESSSSITFSSDTEIAALKAEIEEINKNLMRVLQVNQQVKAVTPNCETCGGPHSFNDCPAIIGQTQNVYAARAYQGNHNPQGNNQRRNQFFQGASHGQNPPPAYQAPVHQPQIPQPQVVTTNEFTNFMKANDAILKNMQPNMTSLTNSNLKLKNMFGQFMKMNIASSSSSRTLPVERETEATKDTVHPTNNGSTKDVRPPVKLRDKANDQREKFFQIFKDLNFNISFADAFILMPKFGPTIKTLLTNKDKMSELGRTPLNEHCSTVLPKKFPEKLGDPNDPTSPEVDQSYVDTEGDILHLKAFLNDDPSLPPPNQGNYLPQVRQEIKICEAKTDKSSIDEPLERRVNPKIHDVIKNEVLKLLDAGLIYPISDSPWAIMEAGSKDRPPMLAPDKEIPISEGSPIIRTERFQETYKNVSQEIRDQLNAKAEAVKIILTGIDNDIYSTVDACPNASGKFTSQDGESLESYYSKFYKMMNELIRNQCKVTNHQVNVQSQQAATRNRGKAIVNSSQPIYDQEPSMVADDDETSKDNEIDKLTALISLSFKKIYKPTNNNLRTSSNTSRANQDNSPRINRNVGYENQRIGNVAGARETVEQADWRDDTDDDELEDQELEAHYMYMAQLQKVSPDTADSGPIFDDEPLQKVLVEKLKGEIEDFKNKNKSLESSNNYFKEANNRLSEINNLLYTDYKKSEAELARCNSMEYASQMEIECAKVRGDFLSYKMEYQKSCTKSTQTINDLNQTISEMKDKLSVHQENISILSQQKETQIKLYKTREDKELDKVIALENKIKVLDNIVYKTGQSVQTMNMLNNKCRTSFAKPEFLNKAQRANPRLYDIDEVTNLQCDYLELSDKCECLETELSKSKIMSKSFKSVQKHAINLELELQQCKEKIKNDKLFKVNQTKDFCKEREQYFEIQDLKAQLQDKGIVISELKKLIEKLKGKSVDTKFEKSSVIRQLNAFKSQRTSILGKPTTFSNSFERKDFSKSKSVTQNNVSSDFSKPVTTQTLPQNKKSFLKNMNVLAPGIPQLKSNPMGDRVMRNSSQGKKQEVEDKRRNVKLSKNKTSITECNDSLNAKTLNVNSLIEIVLFIVDSGYSKHMTGNLKLLINFVEKFLGTVKFGNDQIAPILGYGDLVQGVVTIKRVYYVKGLNHNLFFVGQFCDADLEVAFRKSTCYIRDLKGNDLLTAWLWHRRLSHLNFDTINLLLKNDIVVGFPKLKFVKDHLCSSCELGKAKQKSFYTKITPSSKRRLQLLHMDLCGPKRVASINGKRYVLVIVDDYSKYIWAHFLRSKDETPEVLIDFLRLVQRGLQAQVMSKSSTVSTADAPNQRQQLTTPLNTYTTPAPTCQVPPHAPTVTSTENVNQAEMVEEYAQVENDEFINVFCTPVHDQWEMSSRHVDSSNMHTFYQHHPSEHHWTKYHPLEQVIGNPLQFVRTRRQLESDGEMFVQLWLLVVSYLVCLDSDHAGCLDSRKSTSSGIQFLGGDKLVSWSSKKQDCTSMSSAEAEYVSLSACCAQVLWMRTQLTDYGFHFDKIPIYHFIKEKVEKGIVELFFVRTEYQLAGLFTKALPEERFKYLVRRLDMRCLTPDELEVLANEPA